MTQGSETKVSDFDEFYNKYYNLDGYEHHYKEFYEAGAASRQGEIDELHKKIDLALEKCYTGIRKQGGDYYLELVQDILKGEQTK